MFSEERKRRVYIIFGIITMLFFILIARTSYVMLIWGKELSTITESQYSVAQPISDLNYSLQDYNGKELLNYTTKYYFVVDADTFIKNNRETDAALIKTVIYTLRNYNKDYDLTTLKPGDSKFRLTYTIDETTYNKLKDIKGVKGIYAFPKQEVDRSSPWKYENMLSSIVTADKENKSQDSIEGIIHEATKNNEYPKINFEKDVLGEYKEGNYAAPTNNVNVRLNTDKNMQDDIKEILSQDKYKKYSQIGVVVMEAATGKIKALVQRDDWKENIILGSTTGGYEPGSIFKTIVEEAAIEKKGIPLTRRYVCTEETHNHGNVNMEEAYTVSCNTYFSNLGNEVGFSNILPLATAQGLFSKVLNFSGSGEIGGDYVYPKKSVFQKSALNNGLIDKITGKDGSNDMIGEGLSTKFASGTEAMLSIGQSMRITPIQALSIVNTVVNNGKYVKPYLIDSFVKDSGEVVKKFTTNERAVIRVGTANTLKNQMIKVVRSPKGTGQQAFIPGIEIGGKTGTNTRYESEVKIWGNGEKSNVQVKHSDGWFTGFYRLKGRYYSVVVFVKDIDAEKDGAGSTAVPVFKEVVEKIQKYN